MGLYIVIYYCGMPHAYEGILKVQYKYLILLVLATGVEPVAC